MRGVSDAACTTPRHVVARLHQETTGVVLAADYKARLSNDGAGADGNSAGECASFLKVERDQRAKVSKTADIAPA